MAEVGGGGVKKAVTFFRVLGGVEVFPSRVSVLSSSFVRGAKAAVFFRFPPSSRHRRRRRRSGAASLAPFSPRAPRRSNFAAKISKRRLEEPTARSLGAAAMRERRGRGQHGGSLLLARSLRGKKELPFSRVFPAPPGFRGNGLRSGFGLP